MGNFHISSKGVPAPCKAEPGKCPLTEDDGSPMPHFQNKETALKYIELKAEADAYNSGYKGFSKSNQEVEKDSEVKKTEKVKKTSPKKTPTKKTSIKNGASAKQLEHKKKILAVKDQDTSSLIKDLGADFRNYGKDDAFNGEFESKEEVSLIVKQILDIVYFN